MLEVTCKTCKRTFTTYPSQPRIYCSRECKTVDKTTLWSCAHCGKQYMVPKSLAGRLYCSKECMNADEEYRKRSAASITKERVIVNCKTCGKQIEVLLSKAHRKKYCSRSCRSRDPEIIAKLDRGVTEIVSCKACGKELKRTKSHIRTDVYCSLECMRNRVVVQCDTCGKEVEKTASQVLDHNFCNKSCFWKWLSEDPESLEHMRRIAPMGWLKVGTQPMSSLEATIAANFPELTFVGDGKLWIDIDGKRKKCPDFIVEGTNKVLEVWGDYWHNDEIPEDEMELYASLGYECMVVWGREIERDWEGTFTRIAEFCTA